MSDPIKKLLLILFILLPKWIYPQEPENTSLMFAREQIEADPDTSFYLAKKEYLSAVKTSDHETLANSALILGRILFHQGSFQNASEYLLEAAEIFDEKNEQVLLAITYNWLGTVYLYAKQFPLSYEYYNQAFRLNNEISNIRGIAESHGWMGHYYEKTGKTDTALVLQQKALSLFESIDDLQGMARIYDHMGSIYEDKKQYDSAFRYFMKAYQMNKSLGSIPSMLVNANNIGDIYRKTSQFNLALSYTDSALLLAEKNHIGYQIQSAYRDKAKTYSLMGKTDSALYFQEIAYDLHTNMFTLESARRIAQLQSIYETERKENQIELLKKNEAYNFVINMGLVMTVLLLLIIGGFTVYHQKIKIRQNKKINEQQAKIHATHNELIHEQLKNVVLNEARLNAELENKKLLEDRLRQELTLKSQVLTSHTLQIIRKNNFLEKLKTDLNGIKKTDKNGRHQIVNGMINSINLNFAEDEEWNDFQQVYEQIHADFFTKLKKDFPELSATEIRLCSLLKLNLISNDIASILNISHDSLRVARYRLRKKLNLDKNITLMSFLMKY